MQKFGAQNESLKKNLRAQRFGIASEQASPTGAISDEKLKQRAERFGVVSAPSTPGTNVNAASDLLDKRAKRFGLNENTDTNGSTNKVTFSMIDRLLFQITHTLTYFFF